MHALWDTVSVQKKKQPPSNIIGCMAFRVSRAIETLKAEPVRTTINSSPMIGQGKALLLMQCKPGGALRDETGNRDSKKRSVSLHSPEEAYWCSVLGRSSLYFGRAGAELASLLALVNQLSQSSTATIATRAYV